MAKKEETQPEVLLPETLPLNVALSYATGMKNAYRSFQKIEDVLLSVAHAEQRVSEAQLKQKQIEKEIEELASILSVKRKEHEQQQRANEDIAAQVAVAKQTQEECERAFAEMQKQQAQKEQENHRLSRQAQSEREERERLLLTQAGEKLSSAIRREAEVTASVRLLEVEEKQLQQRNVALKNSIHHLSEEDSQLNRRIGTLKASLETFRAQTAQLSSL